MKIRQNLNETFLKSMVRPTFKNSFSLTSAEREDCSAGKTIFLGCIHYVTTRGEGQRFLWGFLSFLKGKGGL